MSAQYPNPIKIDSPFAKFKNRLNREALYPTPAYWDARVREYKGMAGSMWPNRHLNELYHREHITLIDQELPQIKAKTVLDIGCGIGRISRHLANRGAIVQGVDFSPEAIAVARQNTIGSNPTFRVCSVHGLESDHEFDFAIVFGVLCVACNNRDSLRKTLLRIHRALKPGGTLLLFEPIHLGFLSRVLKVGRRDYVATLEEAGFSLLSFQQMHFWPIMLLISPFHWPRWFTKVGCLVDRVAMRLLQHRVGGDYSVIRAVSKRTCPESVNYTCP